MERRERGGRRVKVNDGTKSQWEAPETPKVTTEMKGMILMYNIFYVI